MSCPTCDHTMEAVGGGIFWCPRCGTQKGTSGHVWTPKLVERCRQLEATGLHYINLRDWHRLGIAESIRVPGRRGAVEPPP